MSSPTSKIITDEIYQYVDIPLQVYFDVAHTGNILLLQKNGKPDEKLCEETWHEILKQNAKENGSLKYEKVFKSTRQHWLMVADYITVKSALTSLMIKQDNELIKELHQRGYHIRKDTIDDYAVSLEAASRKSDNLVTKIISKQNEIELLTGGDAKPGNDTVTQMLVDINCELGFVVPSNILLIEYNAYKRYIKTKKQAERDQLRKLKGRR